VSNLISMDERSAKALARGSVLRDRRYAIRYPFAADVELINLESGCRAEGVTSDLSMGGCFVCTSRPLPVKSRIGMGVEFIDLDATNHQALSRWLDQLRRNR